MITCNSCFFFFQAEDGIRDADVTGVQTCALPISRAPGARPWKATCVIMAASYDEGAPSMTASRAKLFEGYERSIFSTGNTFSAQEYEMMSEFYSSNYAPYLPDKKDARILDVGCGAGHFLYFLKARGYTAMTGID